MSGGRGGARRLLIVVPSLPLVGALLIALCEALGVEPAVGFYSSVYPVAGPLLQLVDGYSFEQTLRGAGQPGWLRYLAWTGLLVFGMFSPAIFFTRPKVFPYCVPVALVAFAIWWLWGLVIVGLGV